MDRSTRLGKAIVQAMVLSGGREPEATSRMVRILLERGADASYCTEKWGAPMSLIMYAAENNWRDICLALVEYGADPTLQEKNWRRFVTWSALECYGRGSVVFGAHPIPSTEVIVADCAEMMRIRSDFLEKKRRRENMERRLPMLQLLYGCGFRELQPQQQQQQLVVGPIPGIPRATPAQNRAFLHGAIFGNRELADQIIVFV
jgi:hypothetical protein